MFVYFVKANPTAKWKQLKRVDDVMIEVGRLLFQFREGIGQGKVVIHMKDVPDLPATEVAGRREAVPAPATAPKTTAVN